MSKRYGFQRILIIMLLGSSLLLLGCFSSQSVLGIIEDAPEVRKVGCTFEEIENEFGPFSMIYFDQGQACFIFEKTPVSFFFDQFDSKALTGRNAADDNYSVPSAVVLRKIKSTEICTGVSGRVKDFGITNPDLLSSLVNTDHLIKSEDETEQYQITLTKSEQFAYIICEHGKISGNCKIRVVSSPATSSTQIQQTTYSLDEYFSDLGIKTGTKYSDENFRDCHDIAFFWYKWKLIQGTQSGRIEVDNQIRDNAMLLYVDDLAVKKDEIIDGVEYKSAEGYVNLYNQDGYERFVFSVGANSSPDVYYGSREKCGLFKIEVYVDGHKMISTDWLDYRSIESYSVDISGHSTIRIVLKQAWPTFTALNIALFDCVFEKDR